MTYFFHKSNGHAHVPVLLSEIMDALALVPGETHIDGTFGAGGYSTAMIAAGAIVHAFDRDPGAIEAGRAVGSELDGKLYLHATEYSNMANVLADEDISGVTLDIGVSSMQIDQAERGFSFQKDGPLDMRMAQEGQSAADFLNETPEEEIADVIYRYGDERKSRRIARSIVNGSELRLPPKLSVGLPKAVDFETSDKIGLAANMLRVQPIKGSLMIGIGYGKGKVGGAILHCLPNRKFKANQKRLEKIGFGNALSYNKLGGSIIPGQVRDSVAEFLANAMQLGGKDVSIRGFGSPRLTNDGIEVFGDSDVVVLPEASTVFGIIERTGRAAVSSIETKFGRVGHIVWSAIVFQHRCHQVPNALLTNRFGVGLLLTMTILDADSDCRFSLTMYVIPLFFCLVVKNKMGFESWD